ncbi:Rho-related GTP-binding protein RhoF [Labeo rohita]|uniref:Rho-related GTP-binding protein RhoF n=1 Tax=Labeo rohita TaxID=84645 RepID=A0ABQ8MPN7_LABRO|nr:Rho-related GTP-binding protein RhoF [Labeo rohita]
MSLSGYNKAMHLDPPASRLPRSVTEYSATKGSSSFSHGHWKAPGHSSLPIITLVCKTTREIAATPERAHVMAATAEPIHKMAAITTLRHVTAAIPVSCSVTAVFRESGQVTAVVPESSKVKPVVPESSQVAAVVPESSKVKAGFHKPSQVIADLHEPRHVSSESTKSRPIMMASVMDPPLMSVQAAGILLTSALSSPLIIEILPPAAALPLMAVAIWCVWAAHCAPEASSVHKSAPEVSSVHESAPEVSSVHESAPEVLSVHESAPEASSVHKSAPEVLSVHESAPVPPEVAAPAAEPPKGAAFTYKLSACSVICLLSSQRLLISPLCSLPLSLLLCLSFLSLFSPGPSLCRGSLLCLFHPGGLLFRLHRPGGFLLRLFCPGGLLLHLICPGGLLLRLLHPGGFPALPSLPQASGPPHGLGPPTLALFHPRPTAPLDCLLFETSGSRSLAGGYIMNLVLNASPFATRGRLAIHIIQTVAPHPGLRFPSSTDYMLQPVMSCINTRPFPLFWAEYWTAFSTLFFCLPCGSHTVFWIILLPSPLDYVRRSSTLACLTDYSCVFLPMYLFAIV